MKRSSAITLVVLGTATLMAGCSRTETQALTQQQYATQQDCERDWQDPSVCQRRASSGGGHVYVGPRYYWNRTGGVPMAVMPDGTERAMPHSALAKGQPSAAKSHVTSTRTVSISRGGFGSSARASSAGG